MRIWVDADACPGVIREILYRAAERMKVELVLVANRPLRTPPSRFIRTIQVAAGFDVADRRIVAEASAGDLVVTGDVPLAAEIVAAGAMALNPRGKLFTAENIDESLAMRDAAEAVRATGELTGGPPPLGKRERQDFANQLDRILTRAASG